MKSGRNEDEGKAEAAHLDTQTQSLLYQEACRSHRFLLSWRHALFGGYLAVLGALGAGLEWLGGYRMWIWGASAALTSVFWTLEVRNRVLYRTTHAAARSLEPEDVPGVYTALADQSDPRTTVVRRTKGPFERLLARFTHSLGLDALFGTVFVVSGATFVLMALHLDAWTTPIIAVLLFLIVVGLVILVASEDEEASTIGWWVKAEVETKSSLGLEIEQALRERKRSIRRLERARR